METEKEGLPGTVHACTQDALAPRRYHCSSAPIDVRSPRQMLLETIEQTASSGRLEAFLHRYCDSFDGWDGSLLL